MKFKSFLFATAIFVASSAAPTFAADKISLMVGGYEKHIYLPAKLSHFH